MRHHWVPESDEMLELFPGLEVCTNCGCNRLVRGKRTYYALYGEDEPERKSRPSCLQEFSKELVAYSEDGVEIFRGSIGQFLAQRRLIARA